MKKNQTERKRPSLNDALKMLLIVKFSIFLMMVCTLQTYASEASNSAIVLQPREVTGTVSDEQGTPLIGVNVVIKGTTTGVVTGIDGSYSITVPDENAVLVLSYIGMLQQEVVVGNQTSIDVVLQEDILALEEIVVIGYGTRVKGELTGAVSSVSSDDIALESSNQLSKALQGKVAGVNVVMDARPGQQAEIRIRGLGTINNNSPLWIVDGVPQGNAPPSSQIESVSVLKDASSTAIYGARGANGVILVTTKSGRKNQKTNVEFDVRTGISLPSNKLEFLLTYQEYGELEFLRQRNDGNPNPVSTLYGSGANPVVPDYLMPAGATEGSAAVDPDLYDIWFPHEDGTGLYQIIKTPEDGMCTDWYDEIYNNALLQDYNLSIRGGTDKTAYSIGANYTTEEAIVKHSDYNRANLRANFTADITDWLALGALSGVTYEEWRGNRSTRRGASPFTQVIYTSPQIPVYDIMGNWAGNNIASMGGDGNNVLARLYRAKDNINKQPRFDGNIFAEISPIDGLKVKTLFGYALRSNRNNSIGYATPEDGRPNPYNSLRISTGSTSNWNWTNTATYTKIFGDHKIELLAGTEAVSATGYNESGYRENYFTTDLDFMVLDAGTQGQVNSGSQWDWSLFSIFGSANYVFSGKYLLDAVIRRDGSSRFGADNRYGVFPAFGAGWVISNESFMSATSSWLNSLKLTASWGQSGNDQIGNYNGFTTFGSSFNRSYYPIDGSDGSSTPGYQSVAFGNTKAKWETTTTTNVAVDVSMFGFMNLSVDVWKKDTEDMLFQKAYAAVFGQASLPSVNIGDMSNTGIDLLLNFRGSAMNGDFSYDVSTVFSRYKNEIVKLSGVEDEFISGSSYRTGAATRAETGTAFPEFYGYEVDGLFQTQAEADAWPEAFGPGGTYNEPGHWRFIDYDGSGTIDTDDRHYLGSPHPDFVLGLNTYFGYKGFDLGAEFYGSFGNMIFANYRAFLETTLLNGGRSPARLYESWGSPYLSNNADATLAKVETSDAASMDATTHYLESGTFFRLRNLQLGYNVPSSFTERLKLTNLRIFIQGSNLFTLTKYSGLDPEVGSMNDEAVSKGMDGSPWPLVKQFSMGLKVGF